MLIISKNVKIYALLRYFLGGGRPSQTNSLKQNKKLIIKLF